MENKRLFPTFEKMYKRIPSSFWEACAFVLLEVLIALLVVEQFTILHCASRNHGFLFFAAGGVLVLFALLYIGFCLFKHNRYSAVELLVTDIAFMFFLVWCGLSTAFSIAPVHSFIGSTQRKEGLVTYLIYAAVIISARAIQSTRYQRILLWSLGGVGSLLAVFTFLQSEATLRWLLSVGNIFPGRQLIAGYQSIFYNSNHFAYFLTMVILALAGLYMFEKGIGRKLTALLLVVVTTVVLMRNNTLGCILAVTFGIVFLCAITFAYNREFFQKSILLLAVYVITASITLGVNASLGEDLREIYDALNNSSEVMTSSSERLLMWQASLEQIAQKPIWGVGLDCGYVIASVCTNDRPHNEYIQYALFTGIPGAIAYLAALVSLFVLCMRNLKKLPFETLILGAMVVGYCVSAFVGNSMYYTTIYFAMILGLIMGSVKNIGSTRICSK